MKILFDANLSPALVARLAADQLLEPDHTSRCVLDQDDPVAGLLQDVLLG